MGSTGSGRFSDYPGGSDSARNTGKCPEVIEVELEDVAQCPYYSNNTAVPARGAHLKLGISGRIVALDENNVVVGLIPTKYNFLFSCMEQGIEYIGSVISSSSVQQMPRVNAQFKKM